MTTRNRSQNGLGRPTIVGLVLAAAVAAIGLGATRAHADPVDLAVVDRDAGQTLQVWRQAGRAFVAGRPGARYSLRLTNNTGKRELVVLSVDGVNVLTGETAAYDQRGYILRPYESYEVSGWRKSDSTVAAFNFTALSSSYAALTGRPGDVGVIGMAVFDERVAPPPMVQALPAPRAAAGGRGGAPALQPREVPPPPIDIPPPPAPIQALPPSPSRPAQNANVAVAPPPAGGGAPALGTGHGAIETSVITIQPFVRATASPQFVWQVQYDSYDNLVAKGVIPPPRTAPRQPLAFPGAGYVPDPPRR
ncbi:MAG: hypothetical protein JWM33_3867 [Caulobacteraceae bacterium]|nr:hypothetical protein [Caulobacteraceae bacterium]